MLGITPACFPGMFPLLHLADSTMMSIKSSFSDQGFLALIWKDSFTSSRDPVRGWNLSREWGSSACSGGLRLNCVLDYRNSPA